WVAAEGLADLAARGAGRGIGTKIGGAPHGARPFDPERNPMDETTRQGVQAYYRLQQALLSLAKDPAALADPQAEQRLSAAAWEANAAMEKAGLLGAGPDHVLDLVRQLYPHFDTEEKI
ncbi:hypothetical protein ACFVRW_23720, partial [Bacillus subtilis]